MHFAFAIGFLGLGLANVAYGKARHALILGSITHHYSMDRRLSKRFSNKIANDGRTIANPLVGYSLQKGSHEATVFAGENSVATPIFGASYAYGSGWIRPLVGAYYQERAGFRRRRLQSLTPFMPVAGIDIRPSFRWGNKDITFHNLITPVVSNHSLSFGIRY